MGLSNNLAERLIKKLVIGRKNWMHSCSFEGTRTSEIILTIYKTTGLNDLDSVKYLTLLFDRVTD